MSQADRGSIVVEGTWMYADQVRCRIAVVRRGIMYGSGDYEDPPEVAEDRTTETFEVLYASPTNPREFCAGGGQFSTLDEACAAAEAACGATVHWEAECTRVRERSTRP
jgi:hypothetical protein